MYIKVARQNQKPSTSEKTIEQLMQEDLDKCLANMVMDNLKRLEENLDARLAFMQRIEIDSYTIILATQETIDKIKEPLEKLSPDKKLLFLPYPYIEEDEIVKVENRNFKRNLLIKHGLLEDIK